MAAPADGILKGMRIVEGSAFVAAPLCGMTLAQLGADVIRFDDLAGGPDSRRWPVTAEGESLFWAGLNKGKRSIAIDLRAAEGRELATRLVTADGADGGLFVTNFPESGWLSYETLRRKRRDLVMVHILGNPDGSSAVDYTVNCAVGLPWVTGEATPEAPVNHLLPAWDVATGFLAATGLLAGERHRRLTGEGRYVRLPLSDVALSVVSALGFTAEAIVNSEPRRPCGNYLYGAFGRDFATRDGRRVMVVGLTARQWSALVKALDMAPDVARIERETGLDLAREGDRFRAREKIAAVVAPWCAARDLAEIGRRFDAAGVCWGPYRTFAQMIAEDARCSPANPMFHWVEQPRVGRVLSPASPLDVAAAGRPPATAPGLGEHTDEILADVLGLPDSEIAGLRDRRVVA